MVHFIFSPENYWMQIFELPYIYVQYMHMYNGNKGCPSVFAGFSGFSGSFWASWKERSSSKCLMIIGNFVFIAIYIRLLNIQLQFFSATSITFQKPMHTN